MFRLQQYFKLPSKGRGLVSEEIWGSEVHECEDSEVFSCLLQSSFSYKSKISFLLLVKYFSNLNRSFLVIICIFFLWSIAWIHFFLLLRVTNSHNFIFDCFWSFEQGCAKYLLEKYLLLGMGQIFVRKVLHLSSCFTTLIYW